MNFIQKIRLKKLIVKYENDPKVRIPKHLIEKYNKILMGELINDVLIMSLLRLQEINYPQFGHISVSPEFIDREGLTLKTNPDENFYSLHSKVKEIKGDTESFAQYDDNLIDDETPTDTEKTDTTPRESGNPEEESDGEIEHAIPNGKRGKKFYQYTKDANEVEFDKNPPSQEEINKNVEEGNNNPIEQEQKAKMEEEMAMEEEPLPEEPVDEPNPNYNKEAKTKDEDQ